MNPLPVEATSGVIRRRRDPRADSARRARAGRGCPRTFALKNRGPWGRKVRPGPMCGQVYAGSRGERPKSGARTARPPGGVAPLYGDLIYAYFHSTCDFSTAAADKQSNGPDPSVPAARLWMRPVTAPTTASLPAVSLARGMGCRATAALYCRGRFPHDERGRGRAATQYDRIGPARTPRAWSASCASSFRARLRARACPDVRAVLRPQPDQLLAVPCSACGTKDSGHFTAVRAGSVGPRRGVFCQWGAGGPGPRGSDTHDRHTYFPGPMLTLY